MPRAARPGPPIYATRDQLRSAGRQKSRRGVKLPGMAAGSGQTIGMEPTTAAGEQLTLEGRLDVRQVIIRVRIPDSDGRMVRYNWIWLDRCSTEVTGEHRRNSRRIKSL